MKTWRPNGTVNYTQNYMDPDTGVHINTIEGTWNCIKLNTNPCLYNRDFVDGNIQTWRRSVRGAERRQPQNLSALWARLHHAMLLVRNNELAPDQELFIVNIEYRPLN